jgi:hypothetical protein
MLCNGTDAAAPPHTNLEAQVKPSQDRNSYTMYASTQAEETGGMYASTGTWDAESCFAMGAYEIDGFKDLRRIKTTYTWCRRCKERLGLR